MLLTHNKHLSIATLNAIFENVAYQARLVFWIRSLDYQQQLYVSPNYQDFWGISCDSLYQHPASWIETLFDDDRYNLKQLFQERANTTDASSEDSTLEQPLYFRVKHSTNSNSAIFIRDKAFVLLDKQQKPTAIAGIGLPLEQNQWENEVEGHVLELGSIEKGFVQLVSELLKLSAQPLTTLFNKKEPTNKHTIYFADKSYSLSRREAECLFYSIKGYSAKEIARLIDLSPRTVETYIEHIKIKVNCRSKLQLIGNVDISELAIIESAF